MNNTIYYDSQVSDHDRREQLYGGQLHAFSPRKSILDFVTFARAMIEDAFGGVDPRTAQDQMEVEAYADLLGKLKPAFIHHPESKRHFLSVAPGNPDLAHADAGRIEQGHRPQSRHHGVDGEGAYEGDPEKASPAKPHASRDLGPQQRQRRRLELAGRKRGRRALDENP
jgi:hypothetical protein